MSRPFFGRALLLHQPDGAPIPVLGWGDQHGARFLTPEGGAVTRDPDTRAYRIESPADRATKAGGAPPPRLPGLARVTRRCDQRREGSFRVQKGDHVGPPESLTLGERVGLCLPIAFPDEPACFSEDAISDFCNQPGYAANGSHGSVYDYFLDNSLGRLRYTNLVAPCHVASRPRAYYANRWVPQPYRAWELIREALAALKARGLDLAALSKDARGFVYALNVLYAGACPNDWGEGLWPHCYVLDPPFDLGGGVLLRDYQITDMGRELQLGTFCHENGHMVCDFPDLYDYDQDSVGVGAWCLMCAGADADPRNPAQFCAWLKLKAGWAGSLRPTPRDGAVVELSSQGNDFLVRRKGNSRAEYFLLENRLRQGRDAGLPGEGLAIWHIDENGDRDANEMTRERHYVVSLEQADGRFDLERTLSNAGDAEDLFRGGYADRLGDDTRPNSRWWSGARTRFEVFEISGPGQRMSLRSRG
jgi:M6 family metalloprotease-like protein